MARLTSSALWQPFRLYYGWVIVAGALTMNMASASLNFVTFSFFLAPMGQELGWNRSEMSWAITFRLLIAGLTGPLLGELIDRIGPRWMGVFGGLLAGAGLVAIAFTSQLWMLYLIYAICGVAGFGGPVGALLTTVPVAKWFIAKRGRAMAIATVGFPAGTVIAIQVAQWLIGFAGWRTAWLVFGVVLWATIMPVSALIMRRAPEDYGLRPDGAADPPPSLDPSGKVSSAPEVNWTRAQALRSPTTWVILTAFAFMGFALSGTLVHRVAFWQSLGMSPTLVALGTAADPFTVIFSGLAFGFLGERLSVRYLGLAAGWGIALSMLPMMFTTGQPYTIFLHNITWGGFAGAFITVNNLIWPNYFGRQSLGAIQGVAMPISIVANGLAAPLYGSLLDHRLNPTIVWTLSFSLFVLGGILLFAARPPQGTDAPSPSVVASPRESNKG